MVWAGWLTVSLASNADCKLLYMYWAANDVRLSGGQPEIVDTYSWPGEGVDFVLNTWLLLPDKPKIHLQAFKQLQISKMVYQECQNQLQKH